MTTWESGRESGLLDDIIAGRKTVEGRLNRGKFADYKVGDIVKLRRDIRDADGVLRDGQLDAARVEITAIRQYASFIDMTTAEGFKNVIPSAMSARDAADEYNKYYSIEDQTTYGVLAVEIKLLHK
jgi:ASC-1-like (ASCH) protein